MNLFLLLRDGPRLGRRPAGDHPIRHRRLKHVTRASCSSLVVPAWDTALRLESIFRQACKAVLEPERFKTGLVRYRVLSTFSVRIGDVLCPWPDQSGASRWRGIPEWWTWLNLANIKPAPALTTPMNNAKIKPLLPGPCIKALEPCGHSKNEAYFRSCMAQRTAY